ncbi:MAG TPA: M55 family metallopeptidase [Chthonomonadaceae bacterium]|nr:M55 family metallopeptidase [Chthonomonadaceae bacterium]
MKIYIMTDLEGPAGVNRWIQTREGETPEKAAAMLLLTGEVNAAIDGIRDAAPEAEIVVLDGHGTGGLAFAQLHPAARSIMHGRGLRAPYGLDTSFDAVFFVGQHAMAGTPDAPLCHTYSSRHIEYYKLNGSFIGEIGCFAAMAGSLGVPTIFLSGDDKACAEAAALIPDIVTVATKQGMGIELALHLSAQRAREEIRAGARRAIEQLSGLAPFRIEPPYTLEIRVLEGQSIGGYLERGAEKRDDRTVLRRSDDLLALF